MHYRIRQSRIATALNEKGLTGFLVTHLPNVRYLCGFTGSSGVLAITHVSGKKKKAAFFTDGRYTQQAKEQVIGAQVKISAGSALTAAIEWLETPSGKVTAGFEADHMTVATRAALGKAAPAVALKPTSGLVEGLRMVKQSEEIAAIRAAVNLASSVFDAVIAGVRPGVSEASVAAEIEYMSRRLGAEGMSFDTLIASGPRSALPHGVASQTPLPASGFVVMDFGVILAGYCSDMTRTVHLGRPDKASKQMYQAVLESQLAGIKAVTPGAKPSEVDYQVRKVLEKSGLGRYFTHSTGHGVGIEIHELPALRKAPKSGTKIANKAVLPSETLQPGMVVTIEPGVYIPGKGGVRIEDMVLVTDTGCEVLTPTPKDLIVI